MITKLIYAWALVAATVTIHCAGLAMILGRVVRSRERAETRFWAISWLLIRITALLILFHLFEIAVWGLFFWWQHCLVDAESSLYFSGTSYTTIGYGDIVLRPEWRLFGPVEGLVGILMCGLSTAFFVALVSKKVSLPKEPK